MKIKNILLIIIASLLIVFTIQSVLALGITPGRTTLNFEPGLQKNVEFSVINSEHKDMVVVFTVRGDFNESVVLSEDYAEFSSSDESKSFTYTLKLPGDLSLEPGMYETEIVALEMPKDIKERGTFVGATVAVITQLHIYVPYPDKYIESKINVIESGEGENTVFLVPVINRGKLDINNIKTVIDIYTSSDEKVATLESDSFSLESLKRKEFVLEWLADVKSDTYRAVAKITYDGKVTEKEIKFNVGKMALEIMEIIIKDFQLGGVAKFDALVENRWSTDLENVFLNILVYDHDQGVMADFKSQTYDMEALSNEHLIAYWDTEGVSAGTYDGELILKYGKYGDKSIPRDVEMEVSQNDIKIFGLTGQVISKEKGIFSVNNLLIALVIFLILGNIFWFIVVKRLKKKRR